MTPKALRGLVGSVIALVIACAAGATLLLGGTAGTCVPATPSGVPSISAPPGGWAPVGRFDAEQVGHAATITAVGAQMGVPARGWIIAVATAIQESGLRNLPGGDRDSVGLFQQRPSKGWGTPQQLRDPVYAAGKFYTKLLTIPGWEHMALTDAAQAVQVSAYPDAYSQHETNAAMLVNNTVGSGGSWAKPEDLEQCASSCPVIMSSAAAGDPPAVAAAAGSSCEWLTPVRAPIVSGFQTPQRPAHNGVDLGAARGTPIRAASAGTVVVVRCNVVPASHGCDRDGSPSTPGCGWYVDIHHAQEIYSRYCHMLTRPTVVEGQPVTAGQVLGAVGSSGHSSGPHLHFEIRLGSRGGAPIDPEAFMATRAPLGQPQPTTDTQE